MKLYSLSASGSCSPIGLPASGLVLGELCRGEGQIKVPLLRGTPTEVGADVGFSAPLGGMCVLTPGRNQPGALVRASCQFRYDKGSHGSLSVFGDATILAQGTLWDGAAGRVGAHPDGLVHLLPGGVIAAKFAGAWRFANKGTMYAVLVGGLPHAGDLAYWEKTLVVDDLPGAREVWRTLLPVLPDSPSSWGEPGARTRIAAALAAGEKMEDEQDAAVPASSGDAPQLFGVLPEGLTLPPGPFRGAGEIGPGGVILPGPSSLVAYTLFSGGGSRYERRLVSIDGVDCYRDYSPEIGDRAYKSSGIQIVGRAVSPSWRIVCHDFKDGACYAVAVWGPEGMTTSDPSAPLTPAAASAGPTAADVRRELAGLGRRL